MKIRQAIPLIFCFAVGSAWANESVSIHYDTGYRGIWYSNQRVDTEYVWKYSGGLGTYCAKHIPMAVYAPEVDKTFFVYGGTKPGEQALLEMVSYYDHATGMVPKPVILLDKQTSDAHDNPVLSLDEDGHLYVFASAHGTARPAYIFRSTRPYGIHSFEQIAEFNYSYPQPWHIPDEGFLFLHTRYDGGRQLHTRTSPDGQNWTDSQLLSFFGEGHYQISWRHGEMVGTAFNYHPEGKGLNYRTNLYYMQTDDTGSTWRNAAGEPVDTPVEAIENRALVRDYQAEGLLVYMKDLNFDADGNPVILHLTSTTWEPGKEGGPHVWRVAHWTGQDWAFHKVAESDNNYDTGSMHIAGDGSWQVIGPMVEGPQRYNPGGEVATTTSRDQGKTWSAPRQITRDSPLNHTYVRRPVNAHAGFKAFWADGHGRRHSESHLYFYAQTSDSVRRLPKAMDTVMAIPKPVQ